MIPNKIGKFALYNKEPNTLDKGYYYQVELDIDVPNKWKKRMVRVYLPSNYDFKDKTKRFPVLYMTDGQNLCDHYLSGYGEWGMDECIEERVDDDKPAFIVVGVDCPHDEKDRCQEMMMSAPSNVINDPHGHPSGKGYANYLARFILDKVKKLVDKTFFTLPDKANTGIGGSSMGGLMSFYIAMKYKDMIGFSLIFSPGFLVYKANYFKKMIKAFNFNYQDYGKLFFYTGGKDFEHDFVSLTLFTFNHLNRIGFNDDQMRLIYDSHNIHHESCWRQYIAKAVSFWLDE